MTSDGISIADWEVATDYAAQIANAACADDDQLAADLTAKFLRYLDELEFKYGKLPSILATRSDYLDDPAQRVALLGEAYGLAEHLDDRRNSTLIAASLAEVFIKESLNVPLARKWLAVLADLLGANWDDLDHEEYESLRRELQRIEATT